jgi:mono/diheme cytochrome c family protein
MNCVAKRWPLGNIPFACAAGLLLISAVCAAAEPDFEKTLAPVVIRHCVACHNSSDPKAGLDLTSASAAFKGGDSGAAMVPGRPSESFLVERISDGSMPPENDGWRLTKEEVAAVSAWIEAGAKWPKDRVLSPFEITTERRAGWDWWSLQRVQGSGFRVQDGGQGPVGRSQEPLNAIDLFTRRTLAAKGLAPSPAADMRTLIRRAYFDLIGLPPTPEELAAHLSAESPDAFERVVDRLLASPHYGERWGRHWLDVVRYGESDGFEHDRYRETSWPYRDYVIASLNADKPYDKFVAEQLAGDVLEPITRDGIAATGFLVAGPWDEIQNVGKSESEMRRAHEEQMEEILAAVSQTFLGLTVNCARCHDHKFDPIPQADYYRLKAVFAGIDYGTGEKRGERPWMTPAELAAHETELLPIRKRADELKQELARLSAAFPGDAVPDPAGARLIEGRFGQAFDARSGHATVPEKKAYASPPLTVECWTKLFSKTGFNILVGCNPKGSLDHWEIYTYAGTGEFSAYLPGFSPPEIKSGVDITDGAWHHVAMTFDGNRVELFIDGRPVKSVDVKRTSSGGPGGPLWIGAIPPQKIGCDGIVDEVRVSRVVRQIGAVPEMPPVADEHTLGLWHLDELASGRLRDDVSSAAPETADVAALRRQQEALHKELQETEAEIARRGVPPVFAGLRKQPPETVVLLRGDIQKPGPAVAPAALSAARVLPGGLSLSSSSPEGERRLAFARWVTDAKNPLTSRVIVNRLWQYHFGRGLVETPSDFGFNGGRPSHPELLDWLAEELVRGGWRLKRLQRRMVCSATYRQGPGGFKVQGSRFKVAGDQSTRNPTNSTFEPETLNLELSRLQSLDADNRLLWRYAPRRLEAEIVRDAMLAASGELNTQMGGPSFKPFTVTVFNTHFYHLFDSGDPQYNRRTVYRASVATGKSPLLTVLDCPAPSLSAPKRQETTTPLQALALMNDSFVQRQAEKMAERILAESGNSATAQVQRAYAIALSREPTAEESAAAEELIQAQTLQELCWALLNSSEFLYVE